MVAEEMVRLSLPVLVKVTDRGMLVVPTAWLPKLRLAGFSERNAGRGAELLLPPPQEAPQRVASHIAETRARAGKDPDGCLLKTGFSSRSR
jgi:hypothetical protein